MHLQTCIAAAHCSQTLLLARQEMLLMDVCGYSYRAAVYAIVLLLYVRVTAERL